MTYMAVIRCDNCNGFLARLTGRRRIRAVIPDDRYADDNNDVIRCGNCGTVHEIERVREAA